jgi:metal-responsive CopG/Arc/MetJ family transcriptional regulator
MAGIRIVVTVDEKTVARLDRFIAEKMLPSRSRAIRDAVLEKLKRVRQSRLRRQCAKLDPEFEKALADEGMASDSNDWPEY